MPPPTYPDLSQIWLLEYSQNQVWIQVPVLSHSQDGRWLYVKPDRLLLQLPRPEDYQRWRIPSPSPDQPHRELDNRTVHWSSLPWPPRTPTGTNSSAVSDAAP